MSWLNLFNVHERDYSGLKSCSINKQGTDENVYKESFIIGHKSWSRVTSKAKYTVKNTFIMLFIYPCVLFFENHRLFWIFFLLV